ncbi:MAG: PadR family transcriptional regulator [Steroidobacteraceae bacterium]
MTGMDDTFEPLRQELRRGNLVLAVMLALRSERYGYTLRTYLAEAGLEVEESTLYPLLRRLESQHLLVSEWREEGRRNKRFYRLAAEAAPVLERLLSEWRGINASIEALSGEPRP